MIFCLTESSWCKCFPRATHPAPQTIPAPVFSAGSHLTGYGSATGWFSTLFCYSIGGSVSADGTLPTGTLDVTLTGKLLRVPSSSAGTAGSICGVFIGSDLQLQPCCLSQLLYLVLRTRCPCISTSLQLPRFCKQASGSISYTNGGRVKGLRDNHYTSLLSHL